MDCHNGDRLVGKHKRWHYDEDEDDDDRLVGKRKRWHNDDRLVGKHKPWDNDDRLVGKRKRRRMNGDTGNGNVESLVSEIGSPLANANATFGGVLQARSFPNDMASDSCFWRDPSAVFLCTDDTVYFEVSGNPRTKKQGSSIKQSFAHVVNETFNHHIGFVPLFSSKSMLCVQTAFYFPLKLPSKTGNVFATADVDNLSKFVLDALNNTLYHDDKQVVKLESYKGFSPHYASGCTTVAISVAARTQQSDLTRTINDIRNFFLSTHGEPENQHHPVGDSPSPARPQPTKQRKHRAKHTAPQANNKQVKKQASQVSAAAPGRTISSNNNKSKTTPNSTAHKKPTKSKKRKAANHGEPENQHHPVGDSPSPARPQETKRRKHRAKHTAPQPSNKQAKKHASQVSSAAPGRTISSNNKSKTIPNSTAHKKPTEGKKRKAANHGEPENQHHPVGDSPSPARPRPTKQRKHRAKHTAPQPSNKQAKKHASQVSSAAPGRTVSRNNKSKSVPNSTAHKKPTKGKKRKAAKYYYI